MRLSKKKAIVWADRLPQMVSRAILYVLLALVTIIMAAPLVWMISTSLKPEGEVLSKTIEWIPRTFTLENYQRIFKNYAIGRWFWNSLIVAVISTIGVLILDSLAAYPLARMQFPGRDLIFILIVSGLMIPVEATVVPLFMLFNRLKLLNTYEALILPVVANCFGVFLLRQFFSTIPTELEDAARIDGASSLQIYGQLILPLSRPALASLAIFTFMSSWNAFLWPLMATNTDKARTLPVGIAMFIGGLGGTTAIVEYGLIMAGASLATAPALIVFLVLQRYFVQGITMTGIKG